MQNRTSALMMSTTMSSTVRLIPVIILPASELRLATCYDLLSVEQAFLAWEIANPVLAESISHYRVDERVIAL